jgi:hypothetical protein
MKRFHAWMISILVALTWTCSVGGQSTSNFEITKVFATLETTVDTLTAGRDENFSLVAMTDVSVDNKIMIPKGSKIVGHVVGVKNKGRDASKSVLGLSIDKAITEHGEIPLQAIIVALAAPRKSDTDTPVGTATNGPERTKPGPPPSAFPGANDVTLLLADNIQGAFGFEDMTISWQLSIPPPLTIFATRGKRLRIEAGSQVLIRMMPLNAK